MFVKQAFLSIFAFKITEMGTIRTLFIILLASIYLHSCNSGYSLMQKYLHKFMQKYPEATLQDIYKGSFQDVFGPAHLLTNRESVKKYIQYEINNADTLKGDEYEPCSWKGRFYRVNLSVIKDGKVPMDEFVDAFMQSANGVDTTLTPIWLEEWELLLHDVKTVAPHIKNYTEDSLAISRLLEEGHYVVHHSQAFNDAYQPHYRIIRKDIFEEKILPKLKE